MLAYNDSRDLLLPLWSLVDEDPLWDTFLRRLLERTQAQRLHLFIRPTGLTGMPTMQRTIRVKGYEPTARAFELDSFSEAGLIPYATLRPNRVYSLEETMLPSNPAVIARQRQVLEEANVAHARFIRVTAAGYHDAWLVLLHDQTDFGAKDSALLSALAPHVAGALAVLTELRGMRLRAAIAEEALALIGVGQALFDDTARAILADDIARQELEIQSNGRVPIRPHAAQQLHDACRVLAAAPLQDRRIVRTDGRAGKDMLMRRAPAAINSPIRSGYSVGLVRRPQRENAAAAAKVLSETLGLSRREAALAEAMGRGLSIVEAGAELQLTPETARNYSKRIYAKTGATGQADLVRIVLTGLAPFA